MLKKFKKDLKMAYPGAFESAGIGTAYVSAFKSVGIGLLNFIHSRPISTLLRALE